MKNRLFLFLFFLLSIPAFSQQANIWYFGENAGIDFNSGSPVAITDGAMNTREGCSVISDDQGRLLFYTDGETVWNSSHTIMENGTGLLGYRSSAQSSLIIPFPCDPNKYYIFTTDGSSSDPPTHRSNFPNDSIFAYSVVDLTFNGGLGKVVQKNIILFSPVDEKVAGVKHANNIDTWVISHKVSSDAFYAYKITSTGIDSPVISRTGPRQETFSGGSHLKVSPDGKYIAQSMSGLQLFTFDNSTGIISHFLSLDYFAYGFTFSPNSKILYSQELISTLVQYNLLAGTPSQIKASKDTICGENPGAGISCEGHAMQIGPDGKIYITRQPNNFYLSVINNPNVFGPGCNYADYSFYLGGKKSSYGLPNFIESYFEPGYDPLNSTCCTITGINLPKDTLFCPNSTVVLNAYVPSATYIWNTGSTDSALTVNLPGNYWVKVTVGTCTKKYFTSVFLNNPLNPPCCDIPDINFSKDTLICADSTIFLNAFVPNATYRWQDGSTNSFFLVNKEGSYWVDVNTSKCKKIFSTTISFKDCIKFIPNLVTVNHDSLNDLFKIQGLVTDDWFIEIYNRWGDLIFKEDPYQNKWNPENVKDGIYFYLLKNKKTQQSIKGWIQVIR